MMYDYDLIIVSKTSDELLGMVQNTIDSCLETANGKTVNVILVETSGAKPADLKGVDEFLMYEGVFNYNRALNLGLKHRKGRVQMLANNDLLFRWGWSDTGEIMRANDILSASLLNQKNAKLKDNEAKAYAGYSIRFLLAGWLIFTQEQIWEKIGELPENYNFWYSDNDYADTLMQHGIMHYLLTNGVVEHLSSQTLRTLPADKVKLYTMGEKNRYERKKKERS